MIMILIMELGMKMIMIAILIMELGKKKKKKERIGRFLAPLFLKFRRDNRWLLGLGLRRSASPRNERDF